MCPNQAQLTEAARFERCAVYLISRSAGAFQLFLGTRSDGRREGVRTAVGKWKLKHEGRKLQRKLRVCVSESVCVRVIGDCRGPNGYQKGSHNKHKGNQTVEITARSKRCIEHVCYLFCIQLHSGKNILHFLT